MAGRNVAVIEEESYYVPDLAGAIEHHKRRGYRLDMIKPADAPREALLSRGRKGLRLTETVSGLTPEPPAKQQSGDWVRGRAGMEYRDLLPGRLNGKIIASHIRITTGGEGADYVHYHKIAFQVLYCLKGRIKVVYEDQGPPFWFEPGDCILQPPGIRHQVLECEANSEVIELTSPAEHETWVDHDITLPTNAQNPDRLFSGQRFLHEKGAEAQWESFEGGSCQVRRTGVMAASDRHLDVRIVRPAEISSAYATTGFTNSRGITIPLENGYKMLVDW